MIWMIGETQGWPWADKQGVSVSFVTTEVISREQCPLGVLWVGLSHCCPSEMGSVWKVLTWL